MIYFDSSYIVRLYIADAGFEAVRELAQTDSIACSLHGRAEVISALHRKYRKKQYTTDEFQRILSLFRDDAKKGSFDWLTISSTILDRVETAYEQLPKTVFLRAADALHLASAAENNLKSIFSNDEKLLTAARYFGLAAVNVI